LIDTVLNFALIPASTSYGGDVAFILSTLVSALIVGYVFAGKLREESRMASIGKVVVLFAVVMMFAVATTSATIGHYNAWADENLQKMYNLTSASSNATWFWYEMMLLMAVTALYAVYTLLFGFIGLYVGSMRKPSAKTKE
jgi:cell division protein ZapA (FtsZ GTPase activity inhibitor)